MKVGTIATSFIAFVTVALLANRLALADSVAPQFIGCEPISVSASMEVPDRLAAQLQCARIAPGNFGAPDCAAGSACFDAVLSLGPRPDFAASRTPALVNGAGTPTSSDPSPVIDLRQDRACAIYAGGREPLKCNFSKAWLVSATGAALPAGASVPPGSKIVLRIVGPHCGNGSCAGRAPPSAAVTLGALPDLVTQQTILGPRNLALIAQAARASTSMRDCNAGTASACLDVLMSGRAEDRPAAKGQLRSIATTGCNANDGKACSDLADQIAADNGPVADRDAARTKGCNLGSAHSCFVLASAMSGDASTSSAAQPLFAKACTGGEGQACEVLAGMYETGDGVSTWSAATKASAMLSFNVYCEAGLPPSKVAPESQADGAGSSHSSSGVGAASGASGSAGGPSSGPRARRGRFASSSMQTLVAMR